MEKTLRASKFYIAYGSPDMMGPFDGFTYGSTERGHILPYFTREQADIVAEAWILWSDGCCDARYASECDAFLFMTPDNGDDDPLIYMAENHEINGVEHILYPLGHPTEDMQLAWSERS